MLLQQVPKRGLQYHSFIHCRASGCGRHAVAASAPNAGVVATDEPAAIQLRRLPGPHKRSLLLRSSTGQSFSSCCHLVCQPLCESIHYGKIDKLMSFPRARLLQMVPCRRL